MKKIYMILLGSALFLASCTKLDLYPLDQGSSETWFSSQTEFEMAVSDLYREVFWPLAEESWTDDYTYRDTPGSAIISGTLNSESDIVSDLWTNEYKSIARANTIILSLQRGRDNGIAQSLLKQYSAEAHFARAARYAQLVFAFGDVVYSDSIVSLEAAYKYKRTAKATVIQKIYQDFDYAIDSLPASYATKQRATKGAALALKARYALYFGDYKIAAEAAKKCIDLKAYSLESDYATLFHTKNSKESIFVIPRSLSLNIGIIGDARSYLSRNYGGYASKTPSWAMLASYECTDGQTIDKSPLFDSKEPFKNRDPRCTASIVAFNTKWLGFNYTPRPDSTKVWCYTTGKKVSNKDNRAVGQYASYDGLLWKKGIDETWGSSTGYSPENDYVFIRYADVLLIYAEAKMELGEIDESVLNAINQVRARAYGVDVKSTTEYPAVTTTDQTELRKVIRRERRVEFALEGLRYYDLIRWKIAKAALNNKNCGMLYPAATLLSNVVKTKKWFWAQAPTFDENGIPDFSALVDGNYAQVLSTGAFVDREYLWPIPAKEVLINPGLGQNDGY